MIDADGKETDTTYDLAGRTIQVSDFDGNTTTFGYDDLDHETSQQTNSQPMLTWQYDTHGNVTLEVDRDGRVTAFSYDELDRPLTEKWYHSQADYASNVSPYYTATTTYDIRSRTVSMVDNYSSLAYGYDNLDRPTTEVIDDTNVAGPVVTLTHGYAATALSPARDDGLETSLTAAIGPSGSQVADFQNLYHYDSDNRLDEVQQSGQTGGDSVAGKFVALYYDDAGRLQTLKRYAALDGSGNPAVQSEYGYDPQTGLLDSLVHGDGGENTFASYGIAYDAAGRTAQVAQQWNVGGILKSESTNCSYDCDGQLTGATYAGDDANLENANEGYQYDDNGNRTSVTVGASTATYGPAADNRVTSDGKYTYAYDDEGNRTYRWIASTTGETQPGANDTDITHYVWDNRNRLTEVTHKNSYSDSVYNQVVDYFYDALNRRIAETVTTNGTPAPTEHYVWDGDQVVLDFLGTNSVPEHRYLAALDQVLAQEDLLAGGAAANALKWLLQDQQGTTRDVVDSSGHMLTHFSYDSYGNVLGGDVSVTRVLFTGYQYDAATAQYYAIARWYDPRTGGFISEDPLGFGAGDVNVNRYCGNGPTDGTNPVEWQW